MTLYAPLVKRWVIVVLICVLAVVVTTAWSVVTYREPPVPPGPPCIDCIDP